MFGRKRSSLVHPLIRSHFQPMPLNRLSLTERRFPHRVRADLQRAIEGLLKAPMRVLGTYGLFKHYDHQGIDFAKLLRLMMDSGVVARRYRRNFR